MEQGSAIWKNERATRIGGSEVAAILGISPYRTAFELWEIKTGKKQEPDIGALPHVQRGVTAEKVFRMELESKHLKNFTPKTWRIQGTPYGASDDGYNEELECILEFKAMNLENHLNAQKGIVPPHYEAQIQYNLFCTEGKAKECWFISVRPEDGSSHIVVVKPDPQYQREIKKAVDVFWFEHVLKDIPPPLSDKDYKLVKDEKFQALAIEYKKLYAVKKEADDRLEEIKAALADFAKDHPAVRGNGVRVKRFERKGSVDYSKVPALTGLDLEPYRRPSSSVVEVRFESLLDP